MIHFGGCAGQLPPFEWGILPLPGLSHHSRDGDLYNLSNCLTIIYCVRRVDGVGGMVKTCSAPVRTPLLFAQTELCHVVSRACALHTTWSHAPRGPRACALCYHLGVRRLPFKCSWWHHLKQANDTIASARSILIENHDYKSFSMFG